jgi:serine/threonine protein kinase
MVSIYPTHRCMPAVQIPANSTLPVRFGPYVLLRPLGRGGMGEVSLAATGSPGCETLCVVKRVLPQKRGDLEYVGRFRDEMELVRRLSHQNLVQTQAVGHIDGELFIAQEFVEGHDLSEVARRCSIDQTVLPLEIIIYIVREVARGLAYAHDFEGLQLVHRDINPVNVRLTYSGDVKVLDFGLATSKAKTFFTQPGTNWGKRAFMAPEQLASNPIDRRADIYVLGILLWESLTEHMLWSTIKDGHVVEPQGGHAAVIERMLHGDVAPPSAFNSQISPELDRVVLKALARQPADRYQSANELRAALGPFLPAGRDVDVELGQLLTRMFDVEKERNERRALVAAAQPLLDRTAADGLSPSAPASDEDVTAVPYLRARSADGPSRPTPNVDGAESDPRRNTQEIPRVKWRRPLVMGVGVAGLIAVNIGLALWFKHGGSQHRSSPVVAEQPIGARAEAPPPEGVPFPSPQPPEIQRAPAAMPPTIGEGRLPDDPAEAAPIKQQNSTAPGPAARRPRAQPPAAVSAESAAAQPPKQPGRRDPTALVTQAADAFQHHRFEDAVRLGQQAKEAGAGAQAHVVLGNVYLAMRRLYEAEQEYGEALSLVPSDSSTRERLAIVRQMLKRETAAEP